MVVWREVCRHNGVTMQTEGDRTLTHLLRRPFTHVRHLLQELIASLLDTRAHHAKIEPANQVHG